MEKHIQKIDTSGFKIRKVTTPFNVKKGLGVEGRKFPAIKEPKEWIK